MGDATGICWVEAKDADQHPAVLCPTRQPSVTRNCPASNISGAEVDKLCSEAGVGELRCVGHIQSWPHVFVAIETVAHTA